jgi:hypothetical protein
VVDEVDVVDAVVAADKVVERMDNAQLPHAFVVRNTGTVIASTSTKRQSPDHLPSKEMRQYENALQKDVKRMVLRSKFSSPLSDSRSTRTLTTMRV